MGGKGKGKGSWAGKKKGEEKGREETEGRRGPRIQLPPWASQNVRLALGRPSGWSCHAF